MNKRTKLKLEKEQLPVVWKNQERILRGLKEDTNTVNEFYSHLMKSTSGFARGVIEKIYEFCDADEFTPEYVLQRVSIYNSQLKKSIETVVIDYQENKK